jgi:hypothetical protein
MRNEMLAWKIKKRVQRLIKNVNNMLIHFFHLSLTRAPQQRKAAHNKKSEILTVENKRIYFFVILSFSALPFVSSLLPRCLFFAASHLSRHRDDKMGKILF